MKVPILFATLLLCGAPTSFAAPVEIGQSSKQVTDTLGKPMGTIELRDKTLLLYALGEVTLKKGLVTDIDLMDEAEFQADQERLRIEREEWLIAQERLAAARIAEGKAIRADKMKSDAFAALPAKDKVDYWRSFQIRYPEVDASEQIASALAGYEIELKELRSQQRIAELEARVAQAEKETAAARLETQKLREETQQSRNSNNGLRFYTYPVYNHDRYYYRPPTIKIFPNKEKVTHYDSGNDYNLNRFRYKHNETVAERATRILNNAQQ